MNIAYPFNIVAILVVGEAGASAELVSGEAVQGAGRASRDSLARRSSWYSVKYSRSGPHTSLPVSKEDLTSG